MPAVFVTRPKNMTRKRASPEGGRPRPPVRPVCLPACLPPLLQANWRSDSGEECLEWLEAGDRSAVTEKRAGQDVGGASGRVSALGVRPSTTSEAARGMTPARLPPRPYPWTRTAGLGASYPLLITFNNSFCSF